MRKFLRYTFWGMREHPGNAMYVMLLFMTVFAGMLNESVSMQVGLLFGLSIYSLIFIPLYIITSYQVGKANKNLIHKYHKGDVVRRENGNKHRIKDIQWNPEVGYHSYWLEPSPGFDVPEEDLRL